MIQFINLDEVDLWAGKSHIKTEIGFDVNEIADGKSLEEHLEGVEYFKELIKRGIPILPPLVKKTDKGYIKLDGFKRLMAYKELGIKEVKVFVIKDGQEIEYDGKIMKCEEGGQSYLIFKHAIDFTQIPEK